jgi:hypothetical protein
VEVTQTQMYFKGRLSSSVEGNKHFKFMPFLSCCKFSFHRRGLKLPSGRNVVEGLEDLYASVSSLREGTQEESVREGLAV